MAFLKARAVLLYKFNDFTTLVFNQVGEFMGIINNTLNKFRGIAEGALKELQALVSIDTINDIIKQLTGKKPFKTSKKADYSKATKMYNWNSAYFPKAEK